MTGNETNSALSQGLDDLLDTDEEVLGEDITPNSGPTLRALRPTATHDQSTRKGIAFTILALIALLYVAAVVAMIGGWVDQDEFALLITGLSGPQALAAAVIGFYYGKKED